MSALRLALVAALLPTPALSQTLSVAGDVAISSDLIDHGRRAGPPGAVLQGAVSLTDAAGWSLGLSASTHIRTGRVVHTVARASVYEALSNDWQSQFSLTYYAYPEYARLRSLDRVEAGFGWTYRDVLAVGLSAMHLFDDRARFMYWAADLSLRWPLSEQLSVAGGVGQTDLASSAVSRYTYGNVGLAWRAGPWHWELSRQASDRRIRQQRGTDPAPRWLTTISRSF